MSSSDSLLHASDKEEAVTIYGSGALEQSQGDLEPPHERLRVTLLFAALIFVQVCSAFCQRALQLALPLPALA
jgi:hypothetical protein